MFDRLISELFKDGDRHDVTLTKAQVELVTTSTSQERVAISLDANQIREANVFTRNDAVRLCQAGVVLGIGIGVVVVGIASSAVTALFGSRLSERYSPPKPANKVVTSSAILGGNQLDLSSRHSIETPIMPTLPNVLELSDAPPDASRNLVTTQHLAERKAKNSSPVGADNRAGVNSRPVRVEIQR